MNTEPSLGNPLYHAALESAVDLEKGIRRVIPAYWHSYIKNVLDGHVAALMNRHNAHPSRIKTAKWDDVPLHQAHQGIHLVVDNTRRLS